MKAQPLVSLWITASFSLGWIGLARDAGAAGPSDSEIRKALGLKSSDPVSVDIVRKRVDALNKSVFEKARMGRTDPSSHPKVRIGKTRKKRGLSTDLVFKRLGKVKNGRIQKADFRFDPHFYDLYDYAGRGYIVLDDVKEVVELGRAGPARKRAIRFVRANDKDKDWTLAKSEVTKTPLAVNFDGIDANRDGKLTVREISTFFAKKANARRQRPSSVQPEKGVQH